MKNIRYRISAWLIVCAFFCGLPVYSYATCTTTNQYITSGWLRGVPYSAGADFPTGGTLYRQLTPGWQNVNYSCTGSNPRLEFYVTGGTLVNGTNDTFSVGLQGIGIKFYRGLNDSGTAITSTGTQTIPLSSASGTISANRLSFFMAAVKTGSITAGTANGSVLPTVKFDVTDDSGPSQRAGYTQWTSSGFIINTPTCTTPDFTYDLGSSLISNSATVSAWTTTAVTLTGCAVFNGNSADKLSYENVTQTALGESNYTITRSGTSALNIITMTLNPQITPVDAANGVLANQSGGSYAQNVGVQLATQSGSVYTPLNLTAGIIVRPVYNSTVSFPLAARMIKTGDVVKPGLVSTSVTYTITYQ
ncbi:fimbrial protein [Enterobacter cloacae]|uniref:fimbrial protein n=1 Tax=Enterobacter cloacae TaxID=550 RepID=UPI002FF90B83